MIAEIFKQAPDIKQAKTWSAWYVLSLSFSYDKKRIRPNNIYYP
jgi:hypothetical protein